MTIVSKQCMVIYNIIIRRTIQMYKTTEVFIEFNLCTIEILCHFKIEHILIECKNISNMSSL